MDWTGNKRTVFSILGASNHSETDRQSEDFYATSPLAIDKLASKFEIPKKVLEPCCGEGHLSERLKELGHEVWSYDIVDRGYGEVQNFFEMLTLPDSLSLSLSLRNRRFARIWPSLQTLHTLTHYHLSCTLWSWCQTAATSACS